jgi:septum formation protein
MAQLVLASRSPQRRAILEQLGVSFSVVAPEVNELTEGPPEELALENAYRKAAAVAGMRPEATVLGVDTIVWARGRAYGKPEDRDSARATLRELSGARHAVISGLCLIERGRTRSAAARTVVEFRRLEKRLIEWYLRSGEWRERAGGYAIQGRGAALVAAIEGDYLNVVGLPVTTLLELEPGLLGDLDTRTG